MRLMSVVLLSALAAYVYGNRCPPLEDLPKGCTCWYSFRFSLFGALVVSCSGSRKDALKIEEIASLLREQFPANASKIDTLTFNDFKGQNSLHSDIFSGLRVRVLKIDNCRFDRWADEVGGPAFVGLEENLKELHILRSIFVNESHSGQKEMPAPFSLGHLRQVTKVKIFQNSLLVFGKDWFGDGGSSVDELDIEQNEIHIVGEEAFVGLTNMRNFKAELNHISVLKRSMFPEGSNLTLLDVRYLAKLILPSNNVRTFSISSNRNNDLESFPEDFFVNFPSLYKIELNGNPIAFVSEEVFVKIWPQLRYIDLKDTLLHCDDHIDWMLDVKEPAELLGWCLTPEELQGETLHYVLSLKGKSKWNV